MTISNPLRIPSMHETKEICICIRYFENLASHSQWRCLSTRREYCKLAGVSKICWVVFFFHIYLIQPPSLFPYQMFLVHCKEKRTKTEQRENERSNKNTKHTLRWKECAVHGVRTGKLYEIKRANVLISFYSFGIGWKQRIENEGELKHIIE